MTVLATDEHFRSAAGLKGRILAGALTLAPAAMALLRSVRPIFRFGSLWVVTRYDDVREVFADDAAFGVPYAANLAIITGGEPFFLGMGNTPEYRAQIDAMRAVVLPSDLPNLGEEAEALARARIAEAHGSIEVVQFVRQVAFALIGRYFGVPELDDGRLSVWASRLFEFQFTGSVRNAAWLAEAQEFATALQAHVDRAIAARKSSGPGPGDILDRCLARQRDGIEGYEDRQIRTALMCMVVGGPPQPPMVLPQAIDQLLRRPDWLSAARDAALSGSEHRLHDILFEAMRFDPLAPGFKRIALGDHVLARGTGRARTVPQGVTIFAATASAMMDNRRIPNPSDFSAERQPHEYMHFGHALHECFGRFINHATLHKMVKPLLERPGLRRARGNKGRLQKRGAFAHQLWLEYDE